jgi:hypothetical protein
MTAISELSVEQVEKIIERTVDRRLEVWLNQMLDALATQDNEAEFRPEFAESLRRSLAQADANEGMSLESFRIELGR